MHKIYKVNIRIQIVLIIILNEPNFGPKLDKAYHANWSIVAMKLDPSFGYK